MALTVKLIGKLGKGRYHDGHGLYLQVMPLLRTIKQLHLLAVGPFAISAKVLSTG
jgi:hypothetical protein